MERLSERFMYYSGILASVCPSAVQDLKHIQNLIDLEEQGLLIKIPCKVGDTVYEVKESITTNGYCIIPRKIRTLTLLMILAGDFGKTVFLTKEEAEAKLRELQGEG